MQNKNALIEYISSRILPGFAKILRETFSPGLMLRSYAKKSTLDHHADLIEAGRLNEIDGLDFEQLISDAYLIDDAFVAELLEMIEPQPAPEPAAEPAADVEHAVVAGDYIASVGATPAEAAEDYAATGLEVRPDGAGGWDALSVSDRDWQPIQIIEISPELAAHIRKNGAPDSWDTIDGVAHLERAAA